MSALLEFVDLEFNRILEDHQKYISNIPKMNDSNPLNVDLLAAVLNDIFPAKNRADKENYPRLHNDLNIMSIRTVGEIKSILRKHADAEIKNQSKIMPRNSLILQVSDKIGRKYMKKREFSLITLGLPTKD